MIAVVGIVWAIMIIVLIYWKRRRYRTLYIMGRKYKVPRNTKRVTIKGYWE